MKTIRLLTTALAAVLLTSLAALAADPSGDWKFTVEGPNGRSADATLTLKLENNQLTGSIDNRAGKAGITEAKFADDQVSFTVVRQIRRRKFTTSYSGKLDGDTIKGTIQTTGRGDKPVSVPWEVTRVK